MGEVLKKSGVQVLWRDIQATAAYGAGAIIPIPALRAFCFQAALVSAFNSLAWLTLFPAMLGFDLKRVTAQKFDVFCCYKQSQESEENAKNVTVQTLAVNEKEDNCKKWTLRYFVTNYWNKWITKTPVRFPTFLLASILTCYGLYGIANIKQGKAFLIL